MFMDMRIRQVSFLIIDKYIFDFYKQENYSYKGQTQLGLRMWRRNNANTIPYFQLCKARKEFCWVIISIRLFEFLTCFFFFRFTYLEAPIHTHAVGDVKWCETIFASLNYLAKRAIWWQNYSVKKEFFWKHFAPSIWQQTTNGCLVMKIKNYRAPSPYFSSEGHLLKLPVLMI